MLQVYSLVPASFGNVPVVVRTRSSGESAAVRIKHVVVSTASSIYVREVLSGDTCLYNGLAPTRFTMALLTVFAEVALVRSPPVGLYGAWRMALHSVRALGVRVALGALPGTIVTGVAGSRLRLAVVGVVIWAVPAMGASRALASLLQDFDPMAPPTFAAVAPLILAIAVVASYVPARRALRVGPAEVLRAD